MFDDCQQQFSLLDSAQVPTTDSLFQQQVSSLIQNFQQISVSVQNLHLFSPNEEIEDITTKNLKFLLTEFYLGELSLKIVDSFREQHLIQSKNYFLLFLNKCEKLNLLHQEDKAALHRETPLDPQERRKEKISRFKREKEATQNYLELLRKRTEGRKQKENGFLSSTPDEEDEEETRDLTKTIIDLSIRKALESLEISQQELSMLTQIEKIKKEHGGTIPKPIEQESMIKTFTIPSQLTQREEVTSTVFQPGYPVHTLTPEQWADQQIQLGLLPQGNSNNNNNNKKKDEEEDEEDEIENEKATLKSREWDNWKDDNPKGSGNKNDRYFRRT